MDDSWALGAAAGQQFHPEPWGSRDGNVAWKTCSSSMYFSVFSSSEHCCSCSRGNSRPILSCARSQHEHRVYLPLNTLSLGCSQEVAAARRQQGWSSLTELP